MKGYESLQKTYNKQKETFEAARERRVANRKSQIEKIDSKILSLQATREKLILENQNEKEFETFDSFRFKAEEQSKLQKSKKRTI